MSFRSFLVLFAILVGLADLLQLPRASSSAIITPVQPTAAVHEGHYFQSCFCHIEPKVTEGCGFLKPYHLLKNNPPYAPSQVRPAAADRLVMVGPDPFHMHVPSLPTCKLGGWTDLSVLYA